MDDESGQRTVLDFRRPIPVEFSDVEQTIDVPTNHGELIVRGASEQFVQCRPQARDLFVGERNVVARVIKGHRTANVRGDHRDLELRRMGIRITQNQWAMNVDRVLVDLNGRNA